MSEDKRKLLRTQGKYGDVANPNDSRSKKIREKGHKNSSTSVDSSSKKTPERNSEGGRELDSSTDENITPIRYEKDSNISFNQLENPKKPIEIKGCGAHTLSVTENGESKILYEPDFLNNEEADHYFDFLLKNIQWDERNIVIRGVEYPQPRLVTWFGPFPYSYSGTTLDPAEMPDIVKEIKGKVEQFLKKQDIDVSFNSVLLNLYRDGKDSVAWHSDDELTMGISPTIASVSLGEIRRFEMRPKMRQNEDSSSSDQLNEYLVHLTHGSLVIMTGCMQEDWQHRVPKEYHDKNARINLTFRTVYPLGNVISKGRKRRRWSWYRNESPRSYRNESPRSYRNESPHSAKRFKTSERKDSERDRNESPCSYRNELPCSYRNESPCSAKGFKTSDNSEA